MTLAGGVRESLLTCSIEQEKVILDKTTAFSTQSILRLCLDIRQQVCIKKLLSEFSSNQYEASHRCHKYIKDVHVTLGRRKKNFFDKIQALVNFEVMLQYRVASLCNQLLPEFSSTQFETLHRCYIQDVY